MSEVFNLSGVVKAFDRSRPAIIDSYLPGGYDTVRDLNKTLDKNRISDANDYNNYYSAFDFASPKFGRINDENVDYIGQALKNSPDASANFKDLQNFQLGNFRDVFRDMQSAGDLKRKLNLAALGLPSGSSGGLYGERGMTNQLSSNAIPLLSGIFGGSANAAQSVSDQNFRQTLLNLGLLDKRLGMVDQPANRLLAPSGVRNTMLNSDTGLLNGIVNAMKNNVAGMRENVSGLGRWGNAIGAVDKSLNSALDTYLSLYSGGAMGGSGLFGMSGTTPSNQMPSMNQQSQGGGINIQQLMAMLNQRGGNQYGGSSLGGGGGGFTGW